MRIFALSDIHVDYEANANWVRQLSQQDYRDDLLILAGDITHRSLLLAWCLDAFARRFRQVLFVPGNHDLWVLDEAADVDSLRKFHEVVAIAEDNGASLRAWRDEHVLIAPLLGWYDYSFGEPAEELLQRWMDFRACRWPPGFDVAQIAAYFTALNPPVEREDGASGTVITFSHFLPRLDLLPPYIPLQHRLLDPVLGSVRLEQQLRRLKPAIHVYGHSHVNRRLRLDGVDYINNAFGYPQEDRIAAKQLLCIHEY